MIDHIPVTSLPRALLDFAAVASRNQLRWALESAQRRDLLWADTCDALIVRARGHHGLGRLQAALALLSDEAPLTQSALEDLFLALLRDAGFPASQPQALVHGYRVDCYWPQHNVVVELDGYHWHKNREEFERDRRMDADFQAAGTPLLRLTHRRLTRERDQVIAQLDLLLPGARGSEAA